jgi:hypothetical protein
MTYQEQIEKMAVEINYPYIFDMYSSSMMLHLLINSMTSGKKLKLSADKAFDQLLLYIFDNTELKEN